MYVDHETLSTFWKHVVCRSCDFVNIVGAKEKLPANCSSFLYLPYCCSLVGSLNRISSYHISYRVWFGSCRTCEYLVRTHMERNDKVILFGDNVFSLKKVGGMGRHDSR